MAFRVKNLMIQALPDASAQPKPAPANPEFCFLSLFPPPPPPHGPTCPTSKPVGPLNGIQDPEILATLKQQLQVAVQAVEAQEKAVNESTTITTVEEAQALEEQLSAALEEVRQQKQQLQNKAAGGGPA